MKACRVAANIIPKCPQISCIYGTHMTSIGKKLQLKMDPSIKRSLCKSCHGFLIVGVTSKVKIKNVQSRKGKKKTKKTQRWICLSCQFTKDFPLKKDHLLWSEMFQSNSQPLTKSI